MTVPLSFRKDRKYLHLIFAAKYIPCKSFSNKIIQDSKSSPKVDYRYIQLNSKYEALIRCIKRFLLKLTLLLIYSKNTDESLDECTRV